MKNLTKLGVYKTNDKKYECYFIPSKKVVKIIAIPKNTGYGRELEAVEADSIQEAREKLAAIFGTNKL
jgi:hypothetical protein